MSLRPGIGQELRREALRRPELRAGNSAARSQVAVASDAKAQRDAIAAAEIAAGAATAEVVELVASQAALIAAQGEVLADYGERIVLIEGELA